MKILDISKLTDETVERVLRAIPFYKSVRKYSEPDYQTLLYYSRIIQFDTGENVLKKGQRDSWSYFLVKGQLVVSVIDQQGVTQHINYVTPGEVFGDLSILLSISRTADVSVDETCREAIIFGTDFSLFGEILDFSVVSLETKLLYYRHTVDTLRWKLEMYRSKYAGHPLANRHREISLFQGQKNGEDELKALHRQSTDYAKVLLEWTNTFGNLNVVSGQVPDPSMTLSK
jgi:hypothetical protein